MKKITGVVCTALAISALSIFSASAEPNATSPGKVDFGDIQPTGDGQFVEVNIQGNLINMVARLTEKSEPEVARILRGLESVRVNVIGLNEQNTSDIKSRIESVRKQLTENQWERIVTVQDKNEDVAIFVKLKGEEAVEGIAITVLSGNREAVFANIVGNIRPEQLAQVAERLNIEPLKKISHELGDE